MGLQCGLGSAGAYLALNGLICGWDSKGDCISWLVSISPLHRHNSHWGLVPALWDRAASEG